jgi:uncharacterized membrane protein SpoIIM required for sporulation
VIDELARYEELLDRSDRLRAAGLAFDELRELGRLYRLASARLARLRQREADPESIHHVNSLCVRGYALLYGSRGTPAEERTPLAARLADALARTWHVQAAAWLLLLLGISIGAGLGTRDEQALYALVPESLGYSDGGLETLVHSEEARRAFLARAETPGGENALFASWLFVHNTEVGLLSFATGILAGVPTTLLQTYNGMLLGAFASIFLRDPWPVAFAAWILPHGIPELTAITLCAAAGLLFGLAVAVPQRGDRRAALRAALDPALLLFGSSLPLFALAAGVESFVRESQLSTAPRLAIAALFASSLAAGLVAVRRLARRRSVELDWLAELSARRRLGSPDSGSARPC